MAKEATTYPKLDIKKGRTMRPFFTVLVMAS